MVLWGQKAGGVKILSPREVYERTQHDSDVVLIDVRTDGEYNAELGHVAGTILLPVQQLEARVGELEKYKSKTIIAICRSGNRSGKAAEFLSQRGFDVFNMAGGMIRWNQENLPAIKGPQK